MAWLTGQKFGAQTRFVGNYSVDGNVMSKTKFLDSIGLERENIARVIMRSPYIFALSIEENMRPKIELLESIGVDKRFMKREHRQDSSHLSKNFELEHFSYSEEARLTV
ncbi:unnamed protein product [Calypogeia fissa]